MLGPPRSRTRVLPGREPPEIAIRVVGAGMSLLRTLFATHVVTAAHCSSLAPGGVANVPLGQPGQLIEVSVGAYRTPSTSLTGGYRSDGEQHVAKSVTVNPGWLGLGSVSHDVAIVEL